MSQALQQEKAIHVCGEVPLSLFANRASNVPHWGTGPRIEGGHLGLRQGFFVDCFLRKHPGYERFRIPLRQSISDIAEYELHPGRWAEYEGS